MPPLKEVVLVVEVWCCPLPLSSLDRKHQVRGRHSLLVNPGMVEEEEKKGVAVSAAVSSLPPRIGKYSPTLKKIFGIFFGGRKNS